MNKVLSADKAIKKARKKEVNKKLQKEYGTKRPGNRQFSNKVVLA